jgi:hypothetical protein
MLPLGTYTIPIFDDDLAIDDELEVTLTEDTSENRNVEYDPEDLINLKAFEAFISIDDTTSVATVKERIEELVDEAMTEIYNEWRSER